MAFIIALKQFFSVKLTYFNNIKKNNTFHFTAEFTCKNKQDEFRPDITLFVNGLPLCFVEAKKLNNTLVRRKKKAKRGGNQEKVRIFNVLIIKNKLYDDSRQ